MVELHFLRVLLLGNILLGVIFIQYLLDNRERRGATSLIVLFVGLLIWLLADSIQLWTPANPAPPIGTHLRLLGADVTIIGLLLFALEYTGREAMISRRLLALLSIKPLVSLVVVLAPRLDGLLVFATPETVTQGYEFVLTPFFLAHVTYNWMLTGLAMVLLGRMMLQRRYGASRQLLVLSTAFVIPIGCNVLLRLGLIRLDLTTAAFFVTATALMYATFRLRLLDSLPIARRTVLSEMDELVFVLDEAGRIVLANRAATDLFGDNTTLLGTDITTVFGDDALTRPDTEEQPVDVATCIDGDVRHFTVSRTPLTDYYETAVGQLLVCRDITERRDRERELEAVNTRLELALDETNTGVWEWDLETDELLWDEASERLFGYAPGTFPGTFEAFAERVHEADRPAVEDALDTALETGGEYKADFRVESVDGTQRWLQSHGVLTSGDSTARGRMIGVQTDISDLVEQRRTLERKNEQLDRFASIISHDLRNPLTVAMGRVELARSEFDSEHLDAARDAHERIEAMIEDLLTLAKAGQTIDATEHVALADVARDAWRNAAVADCEFESSIPVWMELPADRDRLLHVFENLYRNAAEHNDGPVTVRVGFLEACDSADDGRPAGFFIEDDGRGIPAEQHAEIFTHGYTTNRMGTGYGLSIVRDIVEAHGWEITATDGATGGARFEITGIPSAPE